MNTSGFFQLMPVACFVGITLTPAFAESLPANASTSYSAVIHFDRMDYFVENRYGPATPTQSATKLETAIVFNQGAYMEPDSNGHLSLPANFIERVAFVRNASPNAKLTLGVFSLRHIVSKPTALQTFMGEVQGLIDTHGFTGIDIDWEDMPNAATYVSPANYGATIKAISDEFRPKGIVVSTSHAHGAQYETYVSAIANVVDYVNLQFYFAQSNAMDLTTFKSRLSAFIGRGLKASQIRIGLPSYGMTAQSNATSDKWRSWNALRNAGVDLTQANQWTDSGNGQIYYFSGLNLIAAKINYARDNGFAGVFTWELTQDTNYDHALSINRRIDILSAETPVLELNNSNSNTGALGTGVVHLGSGRVLNHGVLRFSRDGTNIYANAVEGSGRLETGGSGTAVLTGESAYAGGTLVAAGSRLNIGNGAAQGSVTGPIEVNGTLAINRSDDINISNVISGTGSLIKAGAGRLLLDEGDLPDTFAFFSIIGGVVANTGDVEYPGDVLVGDAATGTFSQNAGTVTFSTLSGGWGNGVNIGHRNGGVGRYEIVGGTVNVPNANTIISAGGSSNGTLAISGSGTANLKGIGMGTSASGISRVHLNGGRLNVGSGGIFNWTSPSGGGVREIRLESGVLGALDDWSSPVNINLPHSAQGLTIDTTNANSPEVARHIILGGALTGNGNVTLTGLGSLALEGANTYTGTTSVVEGTLLLRGSLTSATTVEGNGKLSGSGSIAAAVTVQSGGVLAPDAAGTITTVGLTLATDSTLLAGGRTSVTGNVNVTGAKIVVTTSPDVDSRVLLSYTGNRTGEFAAATVPAGWKINYDDAAREIQLVRAPGGFGPWIETFTTNGQSGFNDDAENDGFSNGLEFLFGSDPLTAAGVAFPTLVKSEEGNYLYTFQRATRARGHCIIVAKLSDDLITWPPARDIVIGADTAASSQGVEITDQGDHDSISIKVSGEAPRTFIRLEVREP
jgi:autotransporter-associated beta strand protein